VLLVVIILSIIIKYFRFEDKEILINHFHRKHVRSNFKSYCEQRKYSLEKKNVIGRLYVILY